MFPRIKPGILYASLLAGLLIGVLLAQKNLQPLLPVAILGSLGDKITYYLDVSILQLLSILLPAFAYYFVAVDTGFGTIGRRRWLYRAPVYFVLIFLSVGGLMLLATVLEQ